MGRKKKNEVLEAMEAEAKSHAEKVAPEEEDERGEWPASGYKVAKGKSISTGERVMGPGEAIEPEHLHHEESVALKNFDLLLNSGHIVEA